MRPCSTEGCTRRQIARGWCNACYKSWRRSITDPSVLPEDIPGLLARLERRSNYEPNTGCILWSGATGEWGYGRMGWKYHNRRVHCLAWASVHGEAADGLVVRRRCDTPQCLNVDHLELGTIAQNNQDAIDRGRTWSILKEEQVREILRRVSTGEMQYKVAESFGVSGSVVCNIASGKSWKRVPRSEFPLINN